MLKPRTAKQKTAKRKPAKPKPQSLAPRTEAADPEYSAHRGIGYVRNTAGVQVNEISALTQTTVWACVKVISESLAGMPWRVAKLTGDGTTDPLESHPLNWLLNFQPNYETTSFSFRETLWAWALVWGNGYAEIERDTLGRPVALWQLYPSRVRIVRNDAGTLLYEVQNDGEKPTYLQQRDMFHLMGPSPDGLVGWSVIRMHARTIGLAMAQEENAGSFNANDSTPGGLLTHPSRLSDPARKNLEESWARRHRGPTNRRTLAILEEGLKWEQTSLPPEELQLVEQMQLTPAMICRIFRVPPHMVADLTRSTNNNIEHQGLEFVLDCLRPWAERGEGEADVKLFGRNNQATLVTVIDLSERARGDTAAQTQHVREMVNIGVFSINEGRRYLNMKGIGPDGDRRFIQGAMIPLEDAGKLMTQPKPSPPEDSTDEPAADAPTDDEPLARVQERTMAVLVDACRRMLKREGDVRNLNGDARTQWLAKHRDYCREILLPAAGVLGACLSAPPEAIDIAVVLFLTKHFESPSADPTPEAKAVELREYLLAAASAKGAA